MGKGYKTVHNLYLGFQVCNRDAVTWITRGKRWCVTFYKWGVEVEDMTK